VWVLPVASTFSILLMGVSSVFYICAIKSHAMRISKKNAFYQSAEAVIQLLPL